LGVNVVVKVWGSSLTPDPGPGNAEGLCQRLIIRGNGNYHGNQNGKKQSSVMTGKDKGRNSVIGAGPALLESTCINRNAPNVH
jgi:hypothetical protein